MLGAVSNFLAIVAGGLVGLIAGRYLPERVKTGVPGAFGLVCLGLGASLFVRISTFTAVVVALALGTLLGEWLDLDGAISRGAKNLQQWVSERSWGDLPPDKREKFAATFTNLLVLFCAGPVALLGSLREGLTGDISLLAAKSVLDGFTSAIFAPALGVAVLALSLPVLVVEGFYTLSAGLISSLLTSRMTTEISACAGIILLGTGLRILEIKALRTANMLPSLLLVPFASLVLS